MTSSTHHTSQAVTDFPEADHVLKALRLNRTPGWSYPAHYLGMGFESVTPEQAVMGMEPGANVDDKGRPLTVALAVFADIALAAAVRGRVGADLRLATISASLSFSGVPAPEQLSAVSRCGLLSQQDAMTVGGSTVSVTSGDAVVCTGNANFAVMENRAGTAAHPMPGVRDFSQIEPLALHELTEAEHQVLARAHQASQTTTTHFLHQFWGLENWENRGQTPVSVNNRGLTPVSAVAELPCGMHVGNRVGHTQGGILMGLAMSTSLAAPGPGWRVLDIAANFIRPGIGKYLRAQSRVLRVGRGLAQVACDIHTDEGRLVLSSLVTLLRD